MSVWIEGSGDRPLAPQGQHNGVCVDVVDKGVVVTAFGSKRKVELTWELDKVAPNGERFLVWKWFTASLHERAVLRKALETWRGRAFQPADLVKFDLEKLVGKPCQLIVTHTVKADKTYSNVEVILPPSPAFPALTPSGQYVRRKDRTPETTPPVGPQAQAPRVPQPSQTQTVQTSRYPQTPQADAWGDPEPPYPPDTVPDEILPF